MYLKQGYIENNGPLLHFDINLEFSNEGTPKPLILVGANGTGKTNLLSLIADSLFEAAATHYTDVLPTQGLGRAWFRLVGGLTTTTGKAGGFIALRFDDAGVPRFYTEKAGSVEAVDARSRAPQDFIDQINWPTEGAHKLFGIDQKQSQDIFQSGVYTYFPSSRSEVPFWLNREATPTTEFDVISRISNRLRKPIYIERALDNIKQWIISVITDAKIDIGTAAMPSLFLNHTSVEIQMAMSSYKIYMICNKILQLIIDDDQVRFVWLGRTSNEKVGVARGADILLPSLDCLSAGQSILLGMFGTILRYGDLSQKGYDIDLNNLEGICLIDEVDAHIHIGLQNKILPNLIRLFPKVQFLISSHSPIFVLGMEREFGSDGIQVIEMPHGLPVSSESYAEFGKAFDAFAATRAFSEKVALEARSEGKPIVYVEGETDLPYLQRAAYLLNRSDILARCNIEWIGAKDQSGQAFHTGKNALTHTLNVMRANPNLIKRRILLLYDNDCPGPEINYGLCSVRKIPKNTNNTKIKAGIENLFPEELFTEEFYQRKEDSKDNGTTNITITLRKMEFCKKLCKDGTDNDFKYFENVFVIIDEFLNSE